MGLSFSTARKKKDRRKDKRRKDRRRKDRRRKDKTKMKDIPAEDDEVVCIRIFLLKRRCTVVCRCFVISVTVMKIV